MSTARYCIEEFLSSETGERLDETVSETFGVMLGLAAHCDAAATGEGMGEGARTGLIGFSGAMRGSCEIRMGTEAARRIASAMLGGSPIEDGDEESINDSLGEICNMISAGWKNRIDSLAGKCFLSPPTVISGPCYEVVHPQHASVKVSRYYRFDSDRFQITITCVEIAGG